MARKNLSEARLAQLVDQRWTRADAEFVLDALERSGDSVAAFARTHGLSAQKVFWWRSQLMNAEREQAESITFAPVVVTGLGRAPVVVIRRGEVDIEVLDPNAVEPGWLASVARLVGGSER